MVGDLVPPTPHDAPPEGTRELVTRQHRFLLTGGRPVVMGIVNTNPGSFSDAAAPLSTAQLVRRGLDQLEQGAAIIDVGFDSGVTYNDPIPLTDQLAAGMPVVRALVEAGAPVSLDTVSVDVARAGLDLGACLINDVSGLADERMAALATEYGAGLCLMHTRARPKEEHFPDYDDVVEDVSSRLTELTERAVSLGVPAEALVLDPGFDYAKRPHETVAVAQGIASLEHLSRPYLFGVSRKYFAGVLTGAAPPERLPETLATVAHLRAWPSIVRVHDVPEVTRFLTVLDVLDGSTPFPDHDLAREDLKWVRP